MLFLNGIYVDSENGARIGVRLKITHSDFGFCEDAWGKFSSEPNSGARLSSDANLRKVV
jgi:hypothetical protein